MVKKLDKNIIFSLTFSQLKSKILASKAKSEYKQAANGMNDFYKKVYVNTTYNECSQFEPCR